MTGEFRIDRLGHFGDGISDQPAGPVYVPYTLPGETVAAEPRPGHPDRRDLARVVAPSPQRIAPICPHFGVCGGCALQHWAAAPYLAWKRLLVIDALRHAGLDLPPDRIDATIDAHGAGRRRATFHARRRGYEVLEVGFAAPREHRIVAIDDCPILAPALGGALRAAWAIAEAVEETRKPLDIQTTQTDGGLDVDLRGSGPLTAAQSAALARVAGEQALARLTRHGELVAQRNSPTIAVGRATVTLPPGAFLQATVAGEETLARLVVEHAGKARRVADLFCGIGTFALRLAATARVLALDGDAAAVEALRRALPTAPGLKPVEAQKRDLFRQPLPAAALKGFDAVVFDPPRQGAQAQAREIAASTVPLVIAVSCSAGTFARDARILTDAGYRLTRVTPVDQFRYSPHVEVVARLERG